MKRNFLKFLPLAAAVLLATSCSKDDNNEVTVPETPETVTPENSTKTVPMAITVGKKSKSLSKATIKDATSLEQIFEEGDQLYVQSPDKGIWGTLDLETFGENSTTATFSGKVELNEGVELVVGTGLTAKLITANNSVGDEIDEVKTDATSLEEAFQKYGCWQTTESFTYNASSTEIELVEKTAFIEVMLYKDMTGETITIGDEPAITLSAGNTYFAVPDGVTISSSLFAESKTIDVSSGIVVYTIDRHVPEGYVDLGVMYKNQHIYFAESNLYNLKEWRKISDDDKNNMPEQGEWVALKEQCYWKWGNDGTNNGYYVYKVHDAADANQVTNNSSNYSPSTPYTDAEDHIFLSVTPDCDVYGYYWSGEDNHPDAFCLTFDDNGVDPDDRNSETNFCSVRLVRRSN